MNRNYNGYEFHTKSGSVYSIDSEGKLHGRAMFEGCQVEVLQGIESSDVRAFHEPMCYNDKKRTLELLSVYGKEAVKGRRLVILVTDEDARKTGSCGLLSSMLTRDPIYLEERK